MVRLIFNFWSNRPVIISRKLYTFLLHRKELAAILQDQVWEYEKQLRISVDHRPENMREKHDKSNPNYIITTPENAERARKIIDESND